MSLVKSLCLVDHPDDINVIIRDVLPLLDIDLDWDDLDVLYTLLAAEGVKTLYGN